MKNISFAYRSSADAEKFNGGKSCWILTGHYLSSYPDPAIFQENQEREVFEAFVSSGEPADPYSFDFLKINSGVGHSGAIVSDCSKYRYCLWRKWNPNLPMMVWVMLNPSTADANLDDPTIRRCTGFAKGYDCGGIQVYNIFAFRSSDPDLLKNENDPFGPKNHLYLNNIRDDGRKKIIVCGWGSKGWSIKPLQYAYFKAKEILEGLDLKCFGVTQHGHPKHPLYLPANSRLTDYKFNLNVGGK